jgi:ABC-2 type transport system permease protein
MRRFLAIVRVTVFQLIGRRRSIGLLLLAATPAIIMLLVGANVDDRDAEEFFRTGMLPLVLGVTVPIIAIILGSGSLGDERSANTLSYLALRPIRREVIVTAKLFAAWLSSFLVAGVGALLTAIALGLTVGSWDEMFAILVATAITTLGFVAVMQVVGYLTDRAVVIGLAYVLIWEGIVTGAAGQVATTSIWRIGVSAYAGIVAGDHWGSALGLEAQVVADLEDLLSGVAPGAWGALFKVLGLSAVSILVLAYFMRERDLVS